MQSVNEASNENQNSLGSDLAGITVAVTAEGNHKGKTFEVVSADDNVVRGKIDDNEVEFKHGEVEARQPQTQQVAK